MREDKARLAKFVQPPKVLEHERVMDNVLYYSMFPYDKVVISIKAAMALGRKAFERGFNAPSTV